MPEFLPLPVPIRSSIKRTVDDLTEDQSKKRDEVLAHFSKDAYRIPEVEDGDLVDEEKMWLSLECCLRYLRASKWVVATAIQRLEETLKWRREYGFVDGTLTAELVEPESVTGKEIIFGFDVKGRPATYMIPSRQNTSEPTRQLQFAVWMLERAVDLMGPGVESLDLLINFGDRAKNPSIGTARAMLNILQSHYPERLGLALIINVPFFINAFFKVIMPFVDPVTRNKVKFNPNVFEDGFMTKDQVMKEWWGGDREFEWDHSKYWPALVKTCEGRKARQMERWRELGAKVGVNEWDMKDGDTLKPEEDSGATNADDKLAQEMNNLEVNGEAAEDAASKPEVNGTVSA